GEVRGSSAAYGAGGVEGTGSAGAGAGGVGCGGGWGRGRRRGALAGRQEHARLAGTGDVQVVAGPGARHEQHAALPLEVLGVRGGILGDRGERRRGGDRAVLDADDRDRLEL